MKLERLDNIFDIEYGNQFDLYKLKKANDGVNFIARTSENLGVSERVKKITDIDTFPAGAITVSLGGTLLCAFIQQGEFYTGQNIKVLREKRDMSFGEKLFYCKAIELNKKWYSSHGREANKTLNSIKVPRYVPEEFKKLKVGNISNSPIIKQIVSINIKEWKEFKLCYDKENNLGLFDIAGSKTTSKTKLEKYGFGEYPYITTQATNNGTNGQYDFFTEKGNVLTIDSAVLGYCSYQPLDFSASDHVEKLIPKFNLNKYIAMFLVQVLNKEQYRYNYGRKASQERITKLKIKLPSKNGKPDWQFMEDYIKSLPYSASL